MDTIKAIEDRLEVLEVKVRELSEDAGITWGEPRPAPEAEKGRREGYSGWACTCLGNGAVSVVPELQIVACRAALVEAERERDNANLAVEENRHLYEVTQAEVARLRALLQQVQNATNGRRRWARESDHMESGT